MFEVNGETSLDFNKDQISPLPLQCI